MNRQGILIVEDEANLGETLRDYLRGKSHRVEWAPTVKAALQLEAQMGRELDIALLDINLPDGNGLELARELRRKRRDLVMVFLSARNDPALRVEGLEIGAEDYVTKPFELRELTLRLERILQYRRQSSAGPEVFVFGELRFWPRRFEVQDARGTVHPWGQKETAILQYLLQHRNQVVARDELIENIWGEESFPTNRTVDNYMVKLRKWIESDEAMPLRLTSVRGVGYKLEDKA